MQEDPDRADELLRGARERWAALGRPLDAARCTLIHGRVLADRDPAASAALVGEAAAEYEALGVPGLAGRARELVTRRWRPAPAGPDRGTGRARLGAARGPGSIPAVERLGP